MFCAAAQQGAHQQKLRPSVVFSLAISRQAREFVRVAAATSCARARSGCSVLRQGQLHHARLKEAEEADGCETSSQETSPQETSPQAIEYARDARELVCSEKQP